MSTFSKTILVLLTSVHTFFGPFCFSLYFPRSLICSHTFATDRQIKLIKKIHIDIWFGFTRGVCLIFVENLCNTVSAGGAVIAAAVANATTATTIAAYACCYYSGQRV